MSDPVMQNASSSDTPITTSPEIPPNNPIKKKSDRGLFVSVIVALALAAAIRLFVAAPYVVSGTSMMPNFQNWNYLIVDKLSYALETPQRGDVVVLDLPQETDRALIKRIIGLPGDTVVLTGPNPTVTIINASHPDGFVLNEPYIDPANYGGISNARYTLGPGQYFVLGDNRVVSADSRTWGILPVNDIVGRVFLRLYPFNELGILPEEVRYR
jgi:signal peptidase I